MRQLCVLVFALSAAVANDAVASASAPPPDEIERGKDPRGVVLDGLKRGDPNGPCRGNYELAHRDTGRGAEILCTHGPDPAPEGVDVRDRRPPEPAIVEEIAPSGGVAAATTGVQCYGNGSDGYRVHLIYARASNVADRFSSYSASFATWAANVETMLNASAAETGGSKHVRYLTDTACNLVIGRVTLSTTGDDNFSNTISELRSKGYSRTDRKYLVWVDANVYCGIGQIYYDDSASPTPGVNASNGHPQVAGEVARVDNGCWGRANSVEAHELMHNLGGVQTSAPNATSGSHCKDEYDRMCYADGSGGAMVVRCASSHENRFDCNHDDYFHTSPPAGSYLATHWNTANSAFLATAAGTAPPTTTTTMSTTTTTSTTTSTTTTTGPIATKPSAPRNLTARQPSARTVKLTWLAPTTGPVTGYRIYRGTGYYGTPVLLASVGNVTTFTNTGVSTGLKSYYVAAVNSAGQGPVSNRVWINVR